MQNGVTIREKEREWLLVRDGGLWLVGVEVHDKCVLSPVFELHVQVQQRGHGMAVNYGAQPLLLIANLDRWDLTNDANTWPVKGLTVEKHIMSAIDQAEAIVQAMRAQAAGISLATAMPEIQARHK